MCTQWFMCFAGMSHQPFSRGSNSLSLFAMICERQATISYLLLLLLLHFLRRSSNGVVWLTFTRGLFVSHSHRKMESTQAVDYVTSHKISDNAKAQLVFVCAARQAGIHTELYYLILNFHFISFFPFFWHSYRVTWNSCDKSHCRCVTKHIKSIVWMDLLFSSDQFDLRALLLLLRTLYNNKMENFLFRFFDFITTGTECLSRVQFSQFFSIDFPP